MNKDYQQRTKSRFTSSSEMKGHNSHLQSHSIASTQRITPDNMDIFRSDPKTKQKPKRMKVKMKFQNQLYSNDSSPDHQSPMKLTSQLKNFGNQTNIIANDPKIENLTKLQSLFNHDQKSIAGVYGIQLQNQYVKNCNSFTKNNQELFDQKQILQQILNDQQSQKLIINERNHLNQKQISPPPLNPQLKHKPDTDLKISGKTFKNIHELRSTANNSSTLRAQFNNTPIKVVKMVDQFDKFNMKSLKNKLYNNIQKRAQSVSNYRSQQSRNFQQMENSRSNLVNNVSNSRYRNNISQINEDRLIQNKYANRELNKSGTQLAIQGKKRARSVNKRAVYSSQYASKNKNSNQLNLSEFFKLMQSFPNSGISTIGGVSPMNYNANIAINKKIMNSNPKLFSPQQVVNTSNTIKSTFKISKSNLYQNCFPSQHDYRTNNNLHTIDNHDGSLVHLILPVPLLDVDRANSDIRNTFTQSSPTGNFKYFNEFRQ